MATRRDFLRIAAFVPLSGTFGLPLPISGKAAETVVDPASEPLYIGKTMSQWIAKVASGDVDPEEYDVMGVWMFRNFGQAAVPGLIDALKENKGWPLVSELEMLASLATVRALTDALKHEHPKVRQGAQCALFGIARNRLRNSPEYAEPLREAIPAFVAILQREQELEMIHAAAFFLHDFGPLLDPAFVFPFWVSDYGNLYLWACIVGKYPECFPGEEVVSVLAAALEDADPAMRLAAAEALSVVQPDHPGLVPVFVEYAIHQDGLSVSRFSNLDRFIEKALPAIQEALDDARPAQWSAVLYVLGWSGSPAVLPLIIELLEDENEKVRSEAVHCLYFVKDPSLFPLLVSLLIAKLQDGVPSVRSWVRWVFRQRRYLALAALPELVRLLEEGSADGRASAALVVRDLSEDAKTALPALRRNLEHDDPNVRLGAAIAVARFESSGKDLLSILATGINHPEADVREYAIEEIQRIGHAAKAVLPQIVAALQHAKIHERRTWIVGHLLRILGTLGPNAASAIPILVQSFEDQNAWFGIGRQSVLVTLAKIGPAAIEPLMELVRDGNLLGRRRAVEALGLIGPPAKSLVPMFVELSENGPPVMRITAAQAQGNIGPDANAALPVLKKLQEDRDLLLSKRAEEAVRRIEGKATTA